MGTSRFINEVAQHEEANQAVEANQAMRPHEGHSTSVSADMTELFAAVYEVMLL